MNTAEKYIQIRQIVPTKPGIQKTARWEVLNARTSQRVGVIKWYGGFRKYVFYPEPDTFFDHYCLITVGAFIQSQLALRKRNK